MPRGWESDFATWAVKAWSSLRRGEQTHGTASLRAHLSLRRRNKWAQYYCDPFYIAIAPAIIRPITMSRQVPA